MREIILLEEPEVVQYLEKHQLLGQYRKAKEQFKSGNCKQTRLKKRQPTHQGIWYFRLTKKYRALGYFYNPTTFVVVEISDHQ